MKYKVNFYGFAYVEAEDEEEAKEKVDNGEPKITDGNTHIRFLLCQKCYREMGLPNIYMAQEAKRIVWREDDFLSMIKEEI